MKRFYIALIVTMLFACSEEPEELKSPQFELGEIQLLISRDSLPADNYTYAEIICVVDKRPTANDLLVFSTDKGLFANNTSTYSVNVSSSDTTRVYVKYNRPEIARITVSVFGYDTKEIYLNFIPAYPTKMFISPDSATLLPLFKSKTIVTSKLIRLNGVVSEGHFPVYYDSIDVDSGGSIGRFFNSTYSDSQGNSTVEYWLQDTSYHGFVYIKGYVNTDTGRIEGISRILIQ